MRNNSYCAPEEIVQVQRDLTITHLTHFGDLVGWSELQPTVWAIQGIVIFTHCCTPGVREGWGALPLSSYGVGVQSFSFGNAVLP